MTEQEWLASKDPAQMLALLQAGYRSADGTIPWPKISDRKLRLFALACSRLRHPNGYWEGKRVNDLAVYDHMERSADGLEVTKSPEFLPYCEGLHSLVRGEGLDAATAQVGYLAGDEDGSQLAALLREIVGNPFRPVTLPPGSMGKCQDCLGKGRLSLWPPKKGCERSVGCDTCKGRGEVPGLCPWLTPTVLSLAQAAYEERPGRRCQPCGGTGEVTGRDRVRWGCLDCGGNGHMPGSGRVEDGALDTFRLALLADALEETGCMGVSNPCLGCGGKGVLMQAAPDRGPAPVCDLCHGEGRQSWPHPLLAHLRSPGPHVKGCWVVDICCRAQILSKPYIGDSTRRALAHARGLGKVVRFLNEPGE